MAGVLRPGYIVLLGSILRGGKLNVINVAASFGRVVIGTGCEWIRGLWT